MSTFDLRHLMEDKGFCVATEYGARVLIVGAENAPGYGVGFSYPTRELQPGETREFAFGLCGVIDNHGGTMADIARERAAGRCFTVKPGDNLRLSASLVVRVSLDRRRYPVLTPVRLTNRRQYLDQLRRDSDRWPSPLSTVETRARARHVTHAMVRRSISLLTALDQLDGFAQGPRA